MEAKELAKSKISKVIKYTSDLIKSHCKQLFKLTQNETMKSSSANLHRNVQEWSAEQILDCWAVDEACLIEAKAYFNKHAPLVVTCLRLLMENNVQ